MLSAYTNEPVWQPVTMAEGLNQRTVFNKSDISFESVDDVEVEGRNPPTNSLDLQNVSTCICMKPTVSVGRGNTSLYAHMILRAVRYIVHSLNLRVESEFVEITPYFPDK